MRIFMKITPFLWTLTYLLTFAFHATGQDKIPLYVSVDATAIQVEASSEYAEFKAEETINGSGFNNRRHQSHPLGRTMWISQPSETVTKASAQTKRGVAWLKYTFSSIQKIDYIEIWNHNQNDHTNRGLQKVYLQYSADGKSWKTLMNEDKDYFIISESAGRKEEPPGFQLKLPGVEAKYFVITADAVKGNYYRDESGKASEEAIERKQNIHYYGLSEVRFYRLESHLLAKLPEINDFVFKPSQAYRRSDKGPKREYRIEFTRPLYAGGKIRLTYNGHTLEEEIPPSLSGVTDHTSTFPAGLMESDQLFSLELISPQGGIKKNLTIPAARKWTVYFLPHSHLDIGYTHDHKEVLNLQWRNLERAVALAEATRNYPAGSQFRWNCEAMWPVAEYMKRFGNTPKGQKFISAIKRGEIGVDAALGSILTGLSKQEEMMHIFDDAHQLSKEHGIEIKSAMMSDIAGLSWGMVTSFAQNGIKYVSMAPNYVPFYPPVGGSRVGNVHREWGDFPFYWESGSGNEKILFWSAGKGYSFFHSWLADKLSSSGKEPVWQYLGELEEKGYPYDITSFRYTIYGDNGPPDEDMSEIIRSWNETYAYPRFVIGTTQSLFSTFEEIYGAWLPTLKGDMTPFWEDGAASTAKELAMNRRSSDRLNQSEILWSLIDPDHYPHAQFYEGWRNAVLFSEHTWGAAGSGPQPESEFTKLLWAQKRSFAQQADSISRELQLAALNGMNGKGFAANCVHVFNTQLWERTEVAQFESTDDLSTKVLIDESGKISYLQKSEKDAWCFVAYNVPPLGSKVYRIDERKEEPLLQPMWEYRNDTLYGDFFSIAIDKTSGAISHLGVNGEDWEYVGGDGLNEYIYSGRNGSNVERVDTVHHISLIHQGPVYATLRIISDAPGSHSLTRDITVYRDVKRIDLLNVIDKKNVYDYENVRFKFHFNIENPQLKLDIPFEEVTPERDQLAGSNKNFYTVNNGVAVEGMKHGLFLTTLDTPVIETGEMTGEQWLSDTKEFLAWSNSAEQSPVLYSWVMNNSWRTNYKASQSGECSLRYSIIPFHPDRGDFRRRGMEISQPLVATVSSQSQLVESLFSLSGKHEIALSTIRPGTDGHSLLVRLVNTSRQTAHTRFLWYGRPPVNLFECDNREVPKKKISGESLWMKPFEVITLKLEFNNPIHTHEK